MSFTKMAGRPARMWLLALLLASLTIAVYWPVRYYEFSWDDHAYIVQNPHVRRGLSWPNIGWAFTSFSYANWHPVTWLSHMIDAELYGLKPGGHHVTNAILHAANGVLLFFFFGSITGSGLRSAILAALFAVHPLHVESVAWVAERKDLLAMFFFVLTLWSYLRYQRRHSWRPYLLMLILYGLGLMAKPMLVTLPFVLLLLDYWPLGRVGPTSSTSPSASLFREKVPLFLMSAASCVVTYIAQQRGGAVQSTEMIPLVQRLTNVFVSYPLYLMKTVWPADLAVFYPHPRGDLSFGRVLASAGVMVLLSVAAARLHKRLPFMLTGWLWFVGMLVPVIGLVQVGDQALADRYTYVPLIGVFLILVWTLAAHSGGERGRGWRLAVPAVSLASILILALVARVQLGYWRDGTTLFKHALKVTSDNWVAHGAMGEVLAAQGDLKEALVEYRQSLRIRPTYAEGYNNLGTVLNRMGRRREAMDAFRMALSLRDGLAPAHYNLGLALAEEGRQQDALGHYRMAVAANPCAADALTNLGNILDDLGIRAEAEQSYRQAIRCEPDYPGAYFNLGVLQVNQGHVEDAAANLAAALALQPTYPEASALLRKLGKPPR